MKTPESLKSSADARLKEAIKLNERIYKHLLNLREGGPIEKNMPTLRVIVPHLGTVVAEYSAYHNALHTD